MGMRFGWFTTLGLAFGFGATGCGDDGSSSVDDTESPQTASETQGTTGPGETSASASTSSPSTSVATDTDSETGPSDTTTAESSTGEPMLCGLSDDPEQTGPWFRLTNLGNPVEADATIALECGGQGFLMFYLQSQQGGFIPEGETVYYAVTLDVPGFDELSPTGHFYQSGGDGVDVGCGVADESDGGFSLGGIAVIPPDALVDLSMIDGLPATLHVEMLVPVGDPVVLDAELTLQVDPALTVENCGFG